MMKDLKAFITELAGSDALKTGLAEALKNNKLPEFLKENDCDADPAELVEILRGAVAPKEDEAMSADEMDTVAGGLNLQKHVKLMNYDDRPMFMIDPTRYLNPDIDWDEVLRVGIEGGIIINQ